LKMARINTFRIRIVIEADETGSKNAITTDECFSGNALYEDDTKQKFAQAHKVLYQKLELIRESHGRAKNISTTAEETSGVSQVSNGVEINISH